MFKIQTRPDATDSLALGRTTSRAIVVRLLFNVARLDARAGGRATLERALANYRDQACDRLRYYLAHETVARPIAIYRTMLYYRCPTA